MQLDAQHTALTAQHYTLGRQHEELQRTAGTVDTLRGRAQDLRTEIQGLEERRRPLILALDNTPRSGFKCTGSMEPTVTCLDEATWLRDFRPEDVAVGALIAFNPGCGEDEPDHRWTSHRVAAIDVRDGVHYYWPVGDGNPEPDGCWIPESSVRGYMIELHRNARPENAALRDHVLGARTAYRAARDAFDVAKDAYLDIIERYCGHRGTATCYLDPGPYAEADAAFMTHLAAHERMLDARELWHCWLNSAGASQYPGHIPHTCPRSGPVPAAAP